MIEIEQSADVVDVKIYMACKYYKQVIITKNREFNYKTSTSKRNFSV